MGSITKAELFALHHGLLDAEDGAWRLNDAKFEKLYLCQDGKYTESYDLVELPRFEVVSKPKDATHLAITVKGRFASGAVSSDTATLYQVWRVIFRDCGVTRREWTPVITQKMFSGYYNPNDFKSEE